MSFATTQAVCVQTIWVLHRQDCQMRARTRIAIADGDAGLRRQLAERLQRQKTIALVGSFNSMAATIEWLRYNPIDALMTELNLPDGGGLELIQTCLALHPSCEVVVITSSDLESDLLSCIRAGALGYVVKGAQSRNVIEAALSIGRGMPALSRGIPQKLMRLVQRTTAALPKEEAKFRTPALTKREIQILEFIARGLTYVEIGAQLSIALGTVQNHVKSVYRKLEVHSRGRAAYEARTRGLLAKESPAHDL